MRQEWPDVPRELHQFLEALRQTCPSSPERPCEPAKDQPRSRYGMHDAAPVRAIMRWSVALLMLMAVGACGSTAKPGPDGGGGSNAGGAGGTTGDGGRGGGSGGAAGAVGGQGGSGGTGGCAPNQVWCPGCEPGTGACYVGGCPGVACPPPDGGAGASGSNGASGGRGGSGGGSGGTGGSALCGARACTSSELCVRPSCGGTAPRCNPLPDGGQCPTGWTYRAFCNTSPTPGPGCEEPPCTPPAPFCITRPAACGATVTCACLPANVCQTGGGCGFISGGEVLCQSA